MANYSTLKAAIQQVIKANGNNEITGNLLQHSLLAMINSLGAGYQFVGGATPATNPGTPDNNVFYLATENGTYTNFGGIVVSDEIALLAWNGSWSKTSVPAGSGGNSVQIINTTPGEQQYLDILISNSNLALRIDMVGAYSGGDIEAYAGSLIVNIADISGYENTAHYYGSELEKLLDEIEIVIDEDETNNVYLRLTARGDNDFIIFNIYPLDENFSSAELSTASSYTQLALITPKILPDATQVQAAISTAMPWSRTIEPDPEEDFPVIAIEIKGGCILAVDSIGDNSFHGVLNISNVMDITAASFVGYGGIDTDVDVKIGYDDSDPARKFVCIEYDQEQPVVITCLAGTAPNLAENVDISPILSVNDTMPWSNLGAYGKYGIISQTQTWSGTGSKPRTYVMSNKAYGTIPQSFIDVATSAGAIFNETTGYFEIGTLTDISYNEMRLIYNKTIGCVPNVIRAQIMSNYNIRCTLPLWGVSSFPRDYSYMAYNSNLEEITFETPMTTGGPGSNASNIFYGCVRLKKINGEMRMPITTGSINNIFFHCYTLENVSIRNLGASISIADSPNFKPESVAYMINNAGTNNITITLHATAYAAAMADSGVTAALAAHTNVTLASA